jgi:RecB family exonuclease
MADIDGAALIDQARTLLQVWSAGSHEVVASFHCSEQGLEANVSPLLCGTAQESNVSWFPPERWNGVLRLERAPQDECLPHATLEASGGASLIRDQAACPFRSFARHRLNLRSLQPSLIGISASERGAFLHEALFRIWREIQSSDALAALSPAAEQVLLEAAVSGSMQHTESACEARGYSLRERVGPACWQLEHQVCIDMLSQWLGHERERISPFRVVEMEKNRALQVNGLALMLRPDRIDEFADGRRAVIDYKTRAPSKTRWLGDRPQEPQLPLYSLLDSTIQGIAFAELSTTDPVKFVALGEELGLAEHDNKSLESQTRGIATTWSELVELWKASLNQLAVEFMAGAATVTPRPGACDYCDLAPLCRINELRSGAGLETLEDPS